VVVGDEDDPAASDRAPPQPSRVEVLVAAAHTEVERAGDTADDLAGCHAIARGHGELAQADVRRSQPVGMVDRCDQPARHGSGERDSPGADCGHRGPGLGAVLDAPVA
jgi:hypothetical protein